MSARTHVGQDVGRRKDQVLDDEIELVVCVLDARDRNVAGLVDERRQDDRAQVLPEVLLVLQVAVAVEQQVLGQLGPVLAELLVERVVAELCTSARRRRRAAYSEREVLDRVEQVLAVAAVLVREERLAVVAERAALAVALVLHDVARLLEHAAQVRVGALEPLAELVVVLRVDVDLIDGVEDGLHRLVVGEALEEGAELEFGLGDGRVGADRLDVAGALVGRVLGMTLQWSAG